MDPATGSLGTTTTAEVDDGIFVGLMVSGLPIGPPIGGIVGVSDTRVGDGVTEGEGIFVGVGIFVAVITISRVGDGEDKIFVGRT